MVLFGKLHDHDDTPEVAAGGLLRDSQAAGWHQRGCLRFRRR